MQSVKLRILFASVLGLTSLAAFSQHTFFVDTGGADTNPGTMTRPFATLQKAHDTASAGDTIYMRGGTYTFTSQTNISRSGASGSPVRIWAYPGETPVIDAAGQPANSFPVRLNNASFWHIRGLEIKNGAEGGMRIENASNNIIENCNIHHNGRASQWDGKGVTLFGASSNNLLLHNDLHHNRDLQNDNADGVQISVTGSGNVLRGNRFWRNSDDGVDLFNVHDNTDNGSILLENNWAWENGYDDDLNPIGNGMGFKLGGQRPSTTSRSGGHTLKNNVAWANLNHGFDENSATMGLTLYNNTAWNNGSYNYAFWNTGNTFRNNLSHAGQVNAAGDASNNAWTLSVTVTNADFLSLDPSCATGPRKPDGSLPDCAFLHLVQGSDLIDKGVYVGIPFEGSAPDLGAFEYGSGTNRETGAAIRPALTFQAAPNPFSGRISFQAAQVSIFDLSGRKISACRGPKCVWNAIGSPAGVYIARAMVDGRLLERRVLLIR